MKNKVLVFFRPLFLYAAMLVISLSGAGAASITNNDSGFTLTSGTAWFGGVAPGPADVAFFDFNISAGTPANATNLLGANTAWSGIKILDPAVPVQISAGSALTNGAAGIDMTKAANDLTLANPVVLSANQSWLVTNGRTLLVSGVVSGPGALTINGGGATNGTIIFSAANTYTNAVINGGIVVVSNNAAFGVAAGGLTNLGGTIVFGAAAGFTIGNPLVFSNTTVLDGNISNANTGNNTLSLPMSGNGTIIISNLMGFYTNDTSPIETITLGSSAAGQTMNNFSGKIIFAPLNSAGLPSGGNLRFNGGATVNTGSTNFSLNLGAAPSTIAVTLRNGGTVNIGELTGGPGTSLIGSRSTANSVNNWSIGGLNTSTTFTGTIRDCTIAAGEQSALTKVGTGTFTLTGTNTYSGVTTISGGALQIGDGGADGVLGVGPVTVAVGASLIFNRPDTSTFFTNISGGGTIVIADGGTLAVGSGGTLTTPVFIAAGSTLDQSAIPIILSSTVSGFGTVNGSLTATNGGSISPGGAGVAGTNTIAGDLTETGGVINQMELSSVGSTNDLIAVNGNLNLAGLNIISLSAYGSGTIANGIYPLISYTGSLSGGTNNLLVQVIGYSGKLTNIIGSPNQIAVIITPPSRSVTNLTWLGDGANNFWNSTSLNWTNLNGTGPFSFLAGDTVNFTDLGSPNTTVTIQDAFVLPSAVVVSNTQNYTFTGPGNITGPFGLSKTNSGTLTILNTNSYLGKTIIGGGILQVASVANGGAYSPIGAANSDPGNLAFYGGAFRYTGTDASPSMDRGITNVAGVTLDIANAATVFTESGLVTGAGVLTKAGPGTLNIVNVNTYAGGTVISNGLLAMGTNNANYNGAGGSGLGTTNRTVTLNGGTLQLFGWLYASTNSNPLNTFNLFFNPLVVSNGQTGKLQLPPRGTTATGAGAGLNSSLTGGGTLNLVVDYVRYPLSGNWSAFTGLINVTGAGFTNINVNTVGAVANNIDELRINNTFGYTNAAIFLAGSPNGSGNSPPSTLVMCGTVASGTTYNIGELGGIAGTFLGTGTGSEGNTTWSVGWRNTTNTFAGTIANDVQLPGAGVTSITKVGTGTWNLSGQNTYTGSTTVSNGILALIPGVSGDASINVSTNIFINTNAILNFSALAVPKLSLNSGQFIGGGGTFIGNLTANSSSTLLPGGANTAGTLTINGNLLESNGVTNQFALATNGSASLVSDVINVNGNIDVAGGTQIITLNGFGGGPVTNGTFPLFNYTGTLNGDVNNFNVFQVGTFPYITRLTNILASKQIAVVITAARATTNLVWKGDGVNNSWDTITPGEWLAGATPFTFESGDKVFFTDSGLANADVIIQGLSLFPASVVVSNSTAGIYIFDGSGDITGSIGLTKTNSGTLIINNNNTYTGQTIFGGGTISLSSLPNGGVVGPVGAASNNSSNLLFVGGTLAFTGSGVGTDRGLTLNGTGGTINMADGASLQLNGLVVGASGLTKAGNGTLAVTNANSFTGNIVINSGILSDLNVQNVANPVVSGLGNPQFTNRTVTINTNAVLSLDAVGSNEFGNGSSTNLLRFIINQGGLMQITAGNATIGPVTLNGGTLNAAAGSSGGPQFGAFEFSGDITVGGSAPSVIIADNSSATLNLTVNSIAARRIFNVADVTGNANLDLNVTAVLGNSGNSTAGAGLIKTGAGTMTLSAVNTYGGGTIVSNGTLLINGSIGNFTNTLNITNVVNIYGGTLGGSGIIFSMVTNQAQGTLAPGALTNVAGTVLTVNSNLTMLGGSTNIMQVSHSATDKITSSGTITYGGILMVATNAGDATPYSVGDTFTLFNLGGGGAVGSYATIQPPPGPGLGWSGANLTVNGTIAVVSAPLPVVANYTGTPTVGPAALPVTFANTSSGATYWDWNFGDGSALSTNSSANVIHTYTNAGLFTVILKAYGLAGTSSLTNTGYVLVTNLPPVAAFTGTPTNGTAPLAVTFTNTTGGVATSWFWSFGDGTTFTTGASTNVSHTYTNAGSFNVGLTATGSGGTQGITNVAYIIATNTVPVAIFSGTPTNIFVTQSVTFTNTSTGNSLTNWIWNFGDGTPPVTNLSGANIVHAYASSLSSPFTASLTVNGPGGSSTTNRTGYINVYSPPVISSVTQSGGTNLILSGSNGVPSAPYRILSTNTLPPATNTLPWPAIFTNAYNVNGVFNYTNTPLTNAASFFRVVTP
jgi:fibronectin-binding autotransporter adhesin